MKTDIYVKKSKFLSQLLRHKPDLLDLHMDEAGWVPIKELVNSGKFTLEELTEISEKDDKGRYQIDDSKTKIRAVSGHSLDNVFPDLILVVEVPKVLYHGTSSNVIDKIYKTGLSPMTRKYVHLTTDKKRAWDFGKRKGGFPCVICLDVPLMVKDKISFWKPQGKDLCDYYFVREVIQPKYISGTLWSCI